MRLYLSSYHLGDVPEELVRLAGENRTLAIIANAADTALPEKRAAFLAKQIDYLSGLGFQSEEIDLRDYFGKEEALQEKILHFGTIWVSGGNAFVLKRAYEQSGFDRLLEFMLERDACVYAGFSAGIVVVTPTLEGIDLCDDPHVLPEGYKPDFDWKGMGLVNYSLLPHYQSDHPESPLIDKIAAYMTENTLPFRPLRDGEVLVIDGDREWVTPYHLKP